MVKNISFFSGIGTNSPSFLQGEKEGKKAEGNTIFYGNLTTNRFVDPIEARKKEAQKRAFQVVGNAWAADRKIDEDMRERRARVADLMKESSEAAKGIRELTEMQERVKAEYGISEDSREHKDLELLLRERNMFGDPELKNPMSADSLTKEELEYVAKLKAAGLTDYQEKQLELEDAKGFYKKTIKDNKKAIREETAVIRGIRLERLKQDPMVKAAKEAEKIMEESAREIIGMLTEDSREHMDKISEEKKEQAKELEEKQEELEQLLEERKEEEKQLEELLEEIPLEEMLEVGQIRDEIRQQLDKIATQLKLVKEDIKGAIVDENL